MKKIATALLLVSLAGLAVARMGVPPPPACLIYPLLCR